VKSAGDKWMMGTLAVAILAGVVFTTAAIGAPDGTETISLGLDLLSGLLAFAFAGRVLLSFLPAGHVGSFRPRELATTWATSHLLGIGALGFTNALLTTDVGESWVRLVGHPLALLSPWIVLLGVRLISSPGAIAPQHQHTREHLVGWARMLPTVFALSAIYLLRAVTSASVTTSVDLSNTYLGSAVSAFFDHAAMISPGFAWASWTATALLVIYGLKSARRAPVTRWLLGIALLFTPFAAECISLAREELVTTLLFVGGASFGIGWLRHADRRSRSIAVISTLSLILSSWNGWLLAACAIAPLILLTHKVSRRPLALVAGGLWLFAAWPIAGRNTHQIGTIEPDWVTADYWPRIQTWFSTENFALLFVLVTLLTVKGLASYRSRTPRPTDNIASQPSRELIFVLLVSACAFLALHRGFVWPPAELAATELESYWQKLSSLIVLPVAALATGLAAMRGEAK
jgi:hypothetical protein